MNAMRSVRARLLLMVTVVVLVAVVSVGWTSRRGTRVEFGQFVSRLETEVEGPMGEVVAPLRDLESLGEALQESFRSRADWSGAEAVLSEWTEVLDGRTALVVVGASEVVAASEAGLMAAVVEVHADGGVEITEWVPRDPPPGRAGTATVADAQTVAFRGPSRVIRDGDGSEAGVLYLMPALPPELGPHLVDAMGGDFLGSVDRWILGAVVVVGLLALAAAVVFSGRIVGPIEELTEASRRMGDGDLAHRVEVRASDEIGELARAFNSMATSLERNEQLRRNMVSDVAHELRTPLTNLRGQLEAVQDGLSQPTPDLIASLHEETMLLNHLVDDLQELALAEAGQLRLKLEAVDVGAEIERAAEFFEGRGKTSVVRRSEADRTAATIRVDIEDALPPARGDLQRFRQVLRNLLDNAVEHAGGEVVVSARRSARPPSSVTTSLPAPTDAGYVAVTVADSGAGIAPEHAANLFERFYRTDPSRRRTTGGAGLGLAIVRQLVQAQGGCVWVESEPGDGSVFGFCLPVDVERHRVADQ